MTDAKAIPVPFLRDHSPRCRILSFTPTDEDFRDKKLAEPMRFKEFHAGSHDLHRHGQDCEKAPIPDNPGGRVPAAARFGPELDASTGDFFSTGQYLDDWSMHRTTDSSENHTPTENRQRDELLVRNILDTAMDGIISMDSQHRVILFNPAAEAIFGFRAEQVLGRAIDVLIPSRFRLQHHNDVAKFGQGDIQQRRMGQQRTVMALHASGEEFPIESSISQTTVDGEKIYTVIVRDVTEAVRYRQQIEQQSQMLDQVSDAVIVVDLEGRITYWNQAATRQFGWTSAEALGQNANDLLNRGDQNLPAEMQCGGSQGGVWAGELQKTTRSGNRITVEHRRSALRDKDGNVIGCLWIDIDITKRKKWEQASRRSQRLESIGTLAGGIAHDLNNVLTPILMGARMLSSGRAPANPQGLLDTMTASAERGSNLVKQLLAFAGGIRGERSPVAMDVLLAETRLMLEHTLPMSIRFESRVIDGCPLVLGDETELSQVLVNLCINARDAMPDGGSITIEVTSIVLNGNASQLNPEAHPGPYVLLKVTDTGCGMTPDVIDRIFDPFYTTKEVGKGTGLGLATVQGIVKSHDGFISVYSEPGQGTSFSVYLPATQSTLLTPVVRIDHDDESGHGQTILLIDDEAHILQMTALALEHAGYQVITANDGFSGISLFKQFKPKIRAVLLDMMMPGLDGLQTLDQLRQIDTNVVVVACSGLRTSQREAEALERGANAFLPKPYSDDQLAHTLSLLLKTRDRPTLR